MYVLQVPEKAVTLGDTYLEERVYRQEGFIDDRLVFSNHYLQFRGGRKSPEQTDINQPGGH